jgi:AraC-like DNA-binding protein/quercetin dioxygenase-like cupin family protein
LHISGKIWNDSVVKARYTINHESVRLSATHPVNVEWIPVTADIPPHNHDYYETCVVVRGRGRHHTVDGEQVIGPGSVIVIAPGGVHAISAPRDLLVINLYYLSEWMAAGWREQWNEQGLVPLFLAQALFRPAETPRPAVFTLSNREKALVEVELVEARNELSESQPSLLFLKASLLKLLVRLSRARGGDQEEFSPLVWTVVRRIEGSVEKCQPFELAGLFQDWHVTPDRGSRLFRAATGLSPQAYYQRRRIQRACVLLLAGKLSATEIAAELGFADASHFTRHFRSQMGLSPRAYRKRYDACGKAEANASAP